MEKPSLQRSGDIEVFSPEEVWAVVRVAASEQDAAVYLSAAFTGLRVGELLALRWRDVDLAGSALRVRAGFAMGSLTTPKSGKVQAVPLAPDVASFTGQARGSRMVRREGRLGVRLRARAPTWTARHSLGGRRPP